MTSSLPSFSIAAVIASTEPCTSPLTTIGNSLRPAVFRLLIMSLSEVRTMPPPRAASFSRFWRSRYSVISRARASDSTTATRSPASGAPEKPSTSTGVEGTRFGDRLAFVVEQGANAAPLRARDHERADAQRAALDEHGGDGAAAAIEARLDDRAFGVAIGIGDEIEQFGLQRDRLQQLVEVRVLRGGHRHGERFAAELFHLHVMLQQFLHHALRIRLGLVDLVDRHDDGGLGRLGVPDRLDRLRHDAVVGGDDEHDDVGDLGAARAHRGEGRMARRIDERDLRASRRRHLIGADMLGDAAGLARDDVGVADRVEQRRLAVIDVPHDRDDRRARNRATPRRRDFRTGPLRRRTRPRA